MKARHFFWIFALTLSSVVLLSACQSRGNGLAAAIERSQRLSDTSGYDSTEATVRIENSRFPDLVVYVLTEGGMRMRVGMANGNTTTVLKIPESVMMTGSELRFALRPIGGGRETTSDKIYVSPGDEVVLTLLP